MRQILHWYLSRPKAKSWLKSDLTVYPQCSPVFSQIFMFKKRSKKYLRQNLQVHGVMIK